MREQSKKGDAGATQVLEQALALLVFSTHLLPFTILSPPPTPALRPTEIASGPQLGVELDKWVAAKGVEGIVNGMDVEEWSPARDKLLKFKFDATTVAAGKAFAKAELQREAGLPVDPAVPVFGFIGACVRVVVAMVVVG